MKSPTKLNQTICEREKPGSKQVLLWDGGKDSLSGFCLRITPQRVKTHGGTQTTIGGAKSFWLKLSRTRTDSNGQKSVQATWVKIGTFMAGKQGDLTVELARKRAAKLKDTHEQGGDVRAIREEQKNPDDVTALVAAYLEDKSYIKLRPSTKRALDSYLKNYVEPKLGKRYVRDLTDRDIQKLYDFVEKATSTVTANRVIALLSVLMGLAEKKGMRAKGTNPCREVDKGDPEVARERVMDRKELKVLGQAMQTAVANWNTDPRPKDACAISDVSADALRFLALTGLRLGEVLPLKWKDIDMEEGTMRFISHKTSKKAGTKRLPIPPAALMVLKSRKAANEAADQAQEKQSGGVKQMNPYVFRGFKKGGHLVGLERVWLRLREDAGLDATSKEGEVRLHDFRRTYHTVCVELGFGKMVGDLLLGHSVGKIHDTYTNVSSVGILLQASTEVSNWLAAALAGMDPQVGKKVADAQV